MAAQLTNYDLHIDENKSAHHCSAYIGNNLVVRRGQDFKVSLTFSSPLKDSDRLQFVATLATSSRGSGLLEYTFSDSSGPSWAARKNRTSSSSITVTFNTPVDAVIGRYVLNIQTNGATRRIGEFMLICNPWAPDDSVYLSNQDERDEYVLQHFGLICVGDPAKPNAVPWDYGQFEENILYITFVLLDSSLNFKRNPQDDVRKRNDPSYVCRVLSGIVNSNDDNGVVEGNWTGEYDDGKNPGFWNGSSRLLKTWNEQKQPVKYGQCWVFAGVLCTVSRALGIPCRVITNYCSAHDSNGNLSIEEYYDVNGEPLEESDDSIWNFHCWNEGWMKRPDLGAYYTGWQIYDGTPQEKSDGTYQLGPTSQRAVKEGDVDKSYDTRFVFSEVNGDVIKIIVQPDGRKTVGDTNRTKVGQLICTKTVGRDGYSNITNDYKQAEGSSQERQTYNKALRLIGLTPGFLAFSADGSPRPAPSREAEVSGEISFSGSPMVGDDIDAILTLKNLTTKSRNVSVNISVAAIVYNKAVRRKVYSQSVTVNLGPNEEKEIPIKITYSQYEKSLTTDNMINMTAVCQVEEWGDLIVENIIVLKKPPLETKALGAAVLGKPVTVEIKFTNPLPTPVKNCVLTIEGSGLTKNELQKSLDVLEPDKTMKVTVDVKPYMSGAKKLVMNFTCDKFTDVKGFLPINVTEKP
ncbi:protein-glutamine gamma-glutamyltransferase E-like isoform 2-T2 [Anomaloglossus baeobatrachus]|uniref:protein-glutamine gamma-glutamyltransferase E-like isoform X2 n=1 Tax=Anomaloglossus baeobatrachus TaxID=238106 RepID=UPI003F4FAC8F